MDAPTAGLTYVSSPSGLAGTTDENGYFRFVEGDTVTFSVTSSDGSVTIPMGVTSPPTPAAGATAIVSVLALPNGNETAQVIQSFAAGGSDFRTVSISASDAGALRDFITSGGVTTPPTPPSGTFVSQDVAVDTALKYVANLTSQPANNVTTLLSGKTLFTVSTFTHANVVYPNASVMYFAPGGTFHSLCINTRFNGLTANPCATNNGQPVSGSGAWAVVAGVANTFTLTGEAFGPTQYETTVTAPIMDDHKGIFTNTQKNDDVAQEGFGAGKYQVVKSDFSISSLLGKDFIVSGFSECTDGKGLYRFENDVFENALFFQWSCPGGYAGGATAQTGLAINAAIGSTAVPGLVRLTHSGTNGETYYFGISADNTLADEGIAVVATVGNSGSGCSVSAPGNCTGYVKPRSFKRTARSVGSQV